MVSLKRKPRFRWPAIISGAITLAGPVMGILAVVAPKAAAVITGVGAVCQAVTQPLIRKDHER